MINPLSSSGSHGPTPLRPVTGPPPVGVEATAAQPSRSGDTKRVPTEAKVEESQLGQAIRASETAPASSPEAVEAGKALIASGFFNSSEGIAALADAMMEGGE